MSNWDCVARDVEFNLEVSLDEFLNHVDLNKAVLDFGCGYGRISDQLYKAGYFNLVGIDSSHEMINRGLKEFPHLDLHHIEECTLPFRDSQFDGVVVCAVFTCLPDAEIRSLVVAELHRVLKPNGMIHLVEFCSEEGVYFTSKLGVPMWHGNPDEIESLLTGFCIESAKVEKAETMSGSSSLACRIFASKVI